jgi:precorrin-8X/cobalt-precorrin-8 methylmutase
VSAAGELAAASRRHPIEVESFAILAERCDLSRHGPLARQVVARVVHATADPDFAESLVVDESAVAAALAALAAGAPVLTDVEMVRAGISYRPVHCYMARSSAGEGGYPTRSAVAMATAAQRHARGAVVAVGCAPTALVAAVELAEAGSWRPAVVIGLPVGFVGAAESKERARRLGDLGIPVITNIGDKGGSAAATAAVHAIAPLEVRSREEGAPR